jgi:transposase
MTALQRKLLGFALDHMAFLEEQIVLLDDEISQHIVTSDLASAHCLLQTIPGIKQEAASSLLAEFGPDMRVFGSGSKCSAWAGVAPGTNESAGRRKRAPALHGNPWVRATLVECAWSASRKNESEFQYQYERLKPRLGHKRAIVAVAHTLALVIFQVLASGQPYSRAGTDAFSEAQVTKLVRHHTRRLKTLRKRLKPRSPV